MSEPVGNSPRAAGDNYPSNAHKDRAPKPAAAPEAEKEPVVKVVTGKVDARKTPWYKKLSRNIIVGDANTVGEFVVQDVLLPAVRNLIRDAVVGTVERGLYGSARRSAGSSAILGGRPGLQTRYDKMSDPGGRTMSRDALRRHDFAEVALDSLAEAEEVLNTMVYRIERYRVVSVADFYDLVGITGSWADRSWGWDDLRTADIRQSRRGWILDLPNPEPLR